MAPLTTRVADKKVLIPLVFIVMLGCVLRFYGLGRESLWNDELASWVQVSRGSIFQCVTHHVLDLHPPGYRVLLWLVERSIGDSEEALRLPSAVSGGLSIVAIFLAGCLLYSYKEGLIASALLAVSWCPVYYSQEARAYSMLLLFALLATCFWVSVVKGTARGTGAGRAAKLGYIVAAIVTSYLHYFGLYLVMLQGVVALLVSIRRRQALRSVLSVYLPILLAYLPWLPAVLYQVNHSASSIAWVSRPGGMSFLYYLRFLFGESNALVFVVLLLYGFLLARSLCEILRTRRYKGVRVILHSKGFWLGLWLVVPFVGAYIASLVCVPVLTNRNLIISLPAAFLLVARSITRLPCPPRIQGVIVFGIVGASLAHLVFGLNYYSEPHKEQFREAVDLIVRREGRYKNALVIGYAWNEEYFNYYFERSGSNTRVGATGGEEGDIPIISELLSSPTLQYVWYIRGHIMPDPEFVRFLEESLVLIDHEGFIGTEVWLFEKR
jgi:4-amino-4-deoxy-L-arabinose transferase-like glycosyltransferase